MYLVPTMMKRIWRLPEEVRDSYDLTSLVYVWHLAEPCPPWLKEVWIDWLGPDRVFELYAGTEAQAATIITGTEWLAHRGSVGRPTPGTVMICDGNGNELAAGQEGEVWLRTVRERPTYRYIGASARRREGGWESLGDVGWLDEDNYLYLGDRLEDMILTGGANVYPAEVEAALQEHPDIRSVAVIGLPDDDLGSIVHAIVEADPGEVPVRTFSPSRATVWPATRFPARSSTPISRCATRRARYAGTPCAPNASSGAGRLNLLRKGRTPRRTHKGQEECPRRHQAEEIGAVWHVRIARAGRLREDGEDHGPDDHGPRDQSEGNFLIRPVQRPDVAQQHRHADHDGETGAIPGESGALSGQPGIRADAVPTPWSSGAPGGVSATAIAPTTTIPIVRMRGIRDRGKGSPRRMARWLACHCRKLSAATMAPRAISGRPRSRRPHSTWSFGRSCVAATPVAISARAVRFQARNVRSLA